VSEVTEISGVVANNPVVVSTGLTLGATFLARYVWRMLSRDKVETTKDRAETDVVGTLQAEARKYADRADAERARADRIQDDCVVAITKMTDERDAAVAKLSESDRQIASLTAEVHALKEQVAGLRIDVQWLRDHIKGS